MADSVKIKSVPLVFTYAENTDPYRATRLIWEMDDRKDDFQVSNGVVRIRRYPYTILELAFPMTPIIDSNGYTTGYKYSAYAQYNYGVRLQVSQGALFLTNEIRQKYINETIFIAGQDSVDLPYPVMAGLRFYILGIWYDIYGNPLWTDSTIGTPLGNPWPIIFDIKTQRLTFGRQVFGQLRYEYWTDYQVYRYFPTYVGDHELFCTSSTDQYGYIMTFPQFVEADRAPETNIFSIRPPEPLNFEFELYRITSEAVVTSEELWEKPTGFPNSGSFPGKDDVLDYTQGYMLIERVHEIGYVTLFDQQKKAFRAKSTDYTPLPTDFSRQIKKGLIQQGDFVEAARSIDGFITATASNAQKAPKNYFDSVKDVPRSTLRTVRYDVKVGKPYEESDAAKDKRYVIRQITKKNGQVIADTYYEQTQTYKVILKVQIAREPVYDGADRVSDLVNDFSYNVQAQQVNAMMRRVWQSVDWAGVKKIIQAAYPESLYQIDYSALNDLIP